MPLLFQQQQSHTMSAFSKSGFIATERPRAYGQGLVFLLIIFGTAFVVYALIFSYRVTVESEIQTIRIDIDALERSRDKNLEDEIQLFQKRITALSRVLRSHQYMSQLFSVIEDVTLPSAVYGSASISTSDDSAKSEANFVEVNLQGTVPTLIDLGRQMLAYRSDSRIKKGGVTSFQFNSGDAEGIAFGATLSIDKKNILAK